MRQGKMMICVAALVFALCGFNAQAKEGFPLHVAVEFTDHAASAYIAQYKGWFEEEGIRPTFYSYITGMSLAAALGRGDIQSAYICLLPAINARANAGVPIKIVAGTHKHGYGLAVNPDKVKTVKDLQKSGIRIGCVQTGGPVDATLLKTIEKYGLDRSKVLNKVLRMSPPKQMMAIRMGKLDASFSPEHWPAMAEDAGFKMLLSSQDVWPGMQGSVLIVKEELITDHPEIVRKLVAITRKATTWINQTPEEAASVMAAQLQVAGDKVFPIETAKTTATLAISPKTVRRSMGRLEYTTDIDSKGVQEAIDFAVQQGYIRKAFNAGDILDLRFSR
ncbi:MAG: ABC transporter substrate-binding protein [Candidatus Desulfacyla sp.]